MEQTTELIDEIILRSNDEANILLNNDTTLSLTTDFILPLTTDIILPLNNNIILPVNNIINLPANNDIIIFPLTNYIYFPLINNSNLPMNNNIGLPEDDDEEVYNVTWWMILGVLASIIVVVALSLIPLYLPNHGGEEVPQNTDTRSDLLKIQMATNNQNVPTRVTIQIDTLLLTTAVNQAFQFETNTTVTEKCEIVQSDNVIILDRRRRQQGTTGNIGGDGTDQFNIFARIIYPRDCFNNGLCKSAFRERTLNMIRDPTIRDFDIPLADGQRLRFQARTLSIIENSDGSDTISVTNDGGATTSISAETTTITRVTSAATTTIITTTPTITATTTATTTTTIISTTRTTTISTTVTTRTTTTPTTTTSF